MRIILSVVVLLWATTACAEPVYIGIIIDDLGNTWTQGRRAAQLPGSVACAVLPHSRFGKRIAIEAHRQSKEVLLHQPMEPMDADKHAGPGRLQTGMPPLEIALTLRYNLGAVPHVIGINNHMGSRLTQDEVVMQSVMQTLKQVGGLFFVDSLTSPNSVAARSARKQQIPTLVRDIFLDNVQQEMAIGKQLDRLIQLARQRGYALAIGHPYPETLAVLDRRLPMLQQAGVTLVSLQRLFQITDQEPKPWHASSSH